MESILIVLEEHGFPVELAGAEIARAIAARRLRADMIVQVYAPGEPVASCLAREVPLLQKLLGIDPSSVMPSPPPLGAAPMRSPTFWADAPKLLRGQNIALATAARINVHVAVILADHADPSTEVDVSAFLLGPNGRVRGDADFIYYNNDGHGGAVTRHVAEDHPALGPVERFAVLLDSVEQSVHRICFAASIHDGDMRMQSFRLVRHATIAIEDAGTSPVARYDLDEPDGPETALILGELYRRDEGWKFRAVGQGFVGGLGALAKALGVDVREAD